MYAVFEQSDLSVCDFVLFRFVVVFLTTECLSASEKKTVCVSSLSDVFRSGAVRSSASRVAPFLAQKHSGLSERSNLSESVSLEAKHERSAPPLRK